MTDMTVGQHFYQQQVAALEAQDIDALLAAMDKAGVLKPLWANYGLGN